MSSLWRMRRKRARPQLPVELAGNVVLADPTPGLEEIANPKNFPRRGKSARERAKAAFIRPREERDGYCGGRSPCWSAGSAGAGRFTKGRRA
jgi:hypothetical protein